MPKIFKYFLIVAVLLGSGAAAAAPKLCSPGYQDSTCVTPISRAPIAAPQCSTGAGWTTTSNPVWQGAYWSAPGCYYQPPPSCPSGYSQVSGPAWNGSSWVGLNCQPTAPPSPPPAGHVLVATTNTNSCGTLGTFNTYADGTYDASNPDWTQSFSGTWDQMYNSGVNYMNQNYARYTAPMYITQPSDPTTATNYLSRVFFVNNPWACGGGVG